MQEDTDLRRHEVLLREGKGDRAILHDVLLAGLLEVTGPRAHLQAGTSVMHVTSQRMHQLTGLSARFPESH